MYFNKTILILEDNLRVLSKILDKLALLEDDQPYSFSLIVLTNEQQVEDYLNSNLKANFDIALVDRDSALGGSFHKLDVERFGAEKVIGISSIPEYNDELRQRKVTKIVEKDLADIDNFAGQVIRALSEMIRELPKD